MKHLRPLNDWSRHESQFEIKGDFLGEVEVDGQKYDGLTFKTVK